MKTSLLLHVRAVVQTQELEGHRVLQQGFFFSLKDGKKKEPVTTLALRYDNHFLGFHGNTKAELAGRAWATNLQLKLFYSNVCWS